MPTNPPEKSGLFTARNASPNDLRETIKTLVIAVVLALIFRSFVFEPFHIPSGSMKSNLLVGDYLFVSKFSYGYSRWSFPFGFPPFEGRFLETPPKRGDVVVFRLPRDPSVDYIKRLIGLPGDRIQVTDGVLSINDVPVKKEFVDTWTDTEYNPPRVLQRYRETLPEGKAFLTLYQTPTGPAENTRVYTVPPGHYFMMGDNRDNSTDSRFSPDQQGVGFVPADNLVGRADLIMFSWEGWLSFRGDRFFKMIP